MVSFALRAALSSTKEWTGAAQTGLYGYFSVTCAARSSLALGLHVKHQTQKERVEWLLNDLCEQLGYSMAVREPEKFESLVAEGPESFADAVLVIEGLDPQVEKHLRQTVRSFVAERFARRTGVA